MKGRIFTNSLIVILLAVIIVSCGVSTTLESWKSPEFKTGLSKVAVMPLFSKLEYLKPFEQAMCEYFNSKGLKSIGSLDFLNPSIKYPISDIKRKCDSLGVDAILVFDYQGVDKTDNYVPETTTGTGSFGGYWGGGYWGGGYYGGYSGAPYNGSIVTSGGYWTTTAVVRLKANLYTHGSKTAVWTGEISVTDPQYVDLSSTAIAKKVYSDWTSQGLVKKAAK